MHATLDLQDLDRTIAEVAQIYRALTGRDIRPNGTTEIPPERDPVAHVGERLAQLRALLAQGGPVPTGAVSPPAPQPGWTASWPWVPPQSWAQVLPQTPWVPPIDVVECEAELVVIADLPGVGRAETSLVVSDNALVIEVDRRSDRPANARVVHASGRPGGHYRWAVPLPCRVRADKIDARFEEGVLTVRLEREGSVHAGRTA